MTGASVNQGTYSFMSLLLFGLYPQACFPHLCILTTCQSTETQPDTRTPHLVAAMEAMRITEKRYSGIPCIRESMKHAGLAAPLFQSIRGEFRVTLSSEPVTPANSGGIGAAQNGIERLCAYCSTPRSRSQRFVTVAPSEAPRA